ncbi:hypothetical protein RRF57_006592 [Xylaria bambusicola]|uniref:Uncharacterized protein n=1 Tax=Xylaria bambusicola TaxID=326684 RepID=A0AAN7Z6W7_9PEZI
MANILDSQRISNEIHFTVRLIKQHKPSQHKSHAFKGWAMDPETVHTHTEKQWRVIVGPQEVTLDEHGLTTNDEEFNQLKSWCTPSPPGRQSETERTAFADKVQVPGSNEELKEFRKVLKGYIDELGNL